LKGYIMELFILLAIGFGIWFKASRDLDIKQDKIDEEYFGSTHKHLHPRHKVRK